MAYDSEERFSFAGVRCFTVAIKTDNPNEVTRQKALFVPIKIGYVVFLQDVLQKLVNFRV